MGDVFGIIIIVLVLVVLIFVFKGLIRNIREARNKTPRQHTRSIGGRLLGFFVEVIIESFIVQPFVLLFAGLTALVLYIRNKLTKNKDKN